MYTDVTNRILRKENYFLAFVNQGILDFRPPWSKNNSLFKNCKFFSSQKLTNDDILRTDMHQFAIHHKKKRKKRKKKKIKNSLTFRQTFRSLFCPHSQTIDFFLGNETEHQSSNLIKTNSDVNITTNKKMKKSKPMKNVMKGPSLNNIPYQNITHDQPLFENESSEYSDNLSDISSFDENENEEKIKSNDIRMEIHTNSNTINIECNVNDDDVIDDDVEDDERFKKYDGYLGKILEWNVRYIILNFMFTDDLTIKDSFLSNSQKLKQRFFRFGIFNIFLIPFAFVFRIIFFFLKNAEEMHSKKGDLFSFRYTSIHSLHTSHTSHII